MSRVDGEIAPPAHWVRVQGLRDGRLLSAFGICLGPSLETLAVGKQDRVLARCQARVRADALISVEVDSAGGRVSEVVEGARLCT